MNLKQKLYNLCQSYVNQRLQTVTTIISSNQKGLQSETKSSAGDKHETGRAMLQLEMEKASLQLQGIEQMQTILSKIDITNSETLGLKKAHLGAIVCTNKGNYFLAISAGKLTVEDTQYFAISLSSPIGKLLLGKQEKETIVFNGNLIEIEKVL